MFRAQISLVMCSLFAAITGPLMQGFQSDDSAEPRAKQPHYVSAPPSPGKQPEYAKGSGAGYDYSDPLEGRVSALEADVAELKQKCLATPQAAAPKAEVDSKTITEAAKATSSTPAIQVRAGASPEEVVQALNAAGYRAKSGGSSGGVSAPVSYGSSGSSAYSYGSYSAAPSYYYPQPVQETYSYSAAAPSYAYPVSQAYSAAPSVTYRSGLFGRRVQVQSSAAPPTCRVVNGQVICN